MTDLSPPINFRYVESLIVRHTCDVICMFGEIDVIFNVSFCSSEISVAMMGGSGAGGMLFAKGFRFFDFAHSRSSHREKNKTE